MSRIAPEDMTTLISASAAKTIADTAIAELEEMQIAHCINEAANTGETKAYYAKPISQTMLTKLKTEGYDVIQPAPIAKPGDVTIISWADAT
jgi:hypothetical protein